MSSAPHSNDREMPFVQHLLELRDRLLKVILVIAVVLLILMPFANNLFTLLAEPLLRYLPEETQMIAIDVASPFFTPFKLTLVLSIFIAMPMILFHAWAFVAPGLYQHEKKIIFPLLVSSIGLFYLGIAFAYYVVFPLVFHFMVSMTPVGVSMMTDISRYLDFVLKLFFAFGIAFQVPIVTVVLVWMGLVSPQALAEKRPHIIVGAFIIGMLMTPPDVISQTLLAVPIWLLFEIGLLFSRLVESRAQEKEQHDNLPISLEDELDAQLKRHDSKQDPEEKE